MFVRGFKKSLLFVLFVSMLISCSSILTGCNSTTQLMLFKSPSFFYGDYKGSNPTLPSQVEHGSKHEAFEMSEIRSRDEIVATGIVADDVFALLDQFATDMWRSFHPFEKFQGISQEEYDAITIRFEFLSPYIHSYSDQLTNESFSQEYPFYIQEQAYSPWHAWFYKDGIEVVHPELMMHCIYRTSYNVTFVYDNKIYITVLNDIGMFNSDFENLMRACNVGSGVLDDSNMAFANLPAFFGHLYGNTIYDPISLDRSCITNASSDQLWAWYDMISSSRRINLEGKLPVLD